MQYFHSPIIRVALHITMVSMATMLIIGCTEKSSVTSNDLVEPSLIGPGQGNIAQFKAIPPGFDKMAFPFEFSTDLLDSLVNVGGDEQLIRIPRRSPGNADINYLDQVTILDNHSAMLDLGESAGAGLRVVIYDEEFYYVDDDMTLTGWTSLYPVPNGGRQLLADESGSDISSTDIAGGGPRARLDHKIEVTTTSYTITPWWGRWVYR